jgi:hypothetical protein
MGLSNICSAEIAMPVMGSINAPTPTPPILIKSRLSIIISSAVVFYIYYFSRQCIALFEWHSIG